MIPRTSRFAPDPIAGADAPSIAVEVDSDGRVAALCDGWDVLVERHEAPALCREHWLGRALEACLAPSALRSWQALATRAFAAHPDQPPDGPPVVDSPMGPIVAWPIFDAAGRVERLRLWPRVDLDVALGRPLVLLEENGTPHGVNRAGRALLEAAAADELGLDEWLALMQPPRRLVELGVRLDDGELYVARPAAVWNDGWGTVLARAVRAGLHDLANPLAGARMLAEVLRFSDPNGERGGVVEHLDATTTSLRRLRALLAADPRRRIDLRAAFHRAVESLASELARREVEVELDALPEREVTHPEASALPFALAMVLAAVVRAAPGDRIVLALIPLIDGTWRLEAHAAGHNDPPKVVDPSISSTLLHRLAVDIGGRLVIEPGSRPQRDPEWAVEWSREPTQSSAGSRPTG